MTYMQIIGVIILCIFIAVLLYIMIKLTKDINSQIRKCDRMAEWAKRELEKLEKEVEE